MPSAMGRPCCSFRLDNGSAGWRNPDYEVCDLKISISAFRVRSATESKMTARSYSRYRAGAVLAIVSAVAISIIIFQFAYHSLPASVNVEIGSASSLKCDGQLQLCFHPECSSESVKLNLGPNPQAETRVMAQLRNGCDSYLHNVTLTIRKTEAADGDLNNVEGFTSMFLGVSSPLMRPPLVQGDTRLLELRLFRRGEVVAGVYKWTITVDANIG